MLYYDACKNGFHELLNARDRYLNACTTLNVPIHKELFLRFVEVVAIIMSPIIPHFCEHVWREVLGKSGSVTRQPWPKMAEVDISLLAAKDYVDRLIREGRLSIISATAPKKKKKQQQPEAPAAPPKEGRVYVAKRFPAWQEAAISVLKDMLASGPLPDLKALVPLLSKDSRTQPHMKNKKMMPFVKQMVERAQTEGSSCLDRKNAFEEKEVLDLNAELVRLSLGLESLKVIEEPTEEADAQPMAEAVPGEPSFAAF